MAQVSLGSLFWTPPIALTTMSALPANPYSGPLQFVDRVRGPIGLDAYGIDWNFTIVPPGIGTTIDAEITYDRPLLEIKEIATDLGGTLVAGQVYLSNKEAGRIIFSQFPLTRLGLWVYPFCEVQLRWVLVL